MSSAFPDHSGVRARIDGGSLRVAGPEKGRLGQRLASGDGVYVEWWIEGQRLQVRSDRYGFFPCYYVASGDELVLSPHIEDLLPGLEERALDADALSVFLRAGFFIGDDTPFKAVRAIGPGTSLAWGPAGLEVTSGPRTYTGGVAGQSRDRLVEAYVDLFRQAIARRLPRSDAVAIPISGGRDSRHILLELLRSGHTPRYCVNFDYGPLLPNLEHTETSQLLQRLGLPRTRLSQPDRRLRAEVLKNRLTNFCSLEHVWYLPLRDFLQHRNLVIYDGIAGDVLSESSLATPERVAWYRAGELHRLADDILGPEARVDSLLSREATRRFPRRRAIERLVVELQHHREAANPLGAFFFFNRTRRNVSLLPFRMLDPAAAVHTPYLDRDLFDFLSTLPAELVSGGGLHTEAIRRAHPHVADVPFADSQRPAAGRCWRHTSRIGFELATRYLRCRPRLLRHEFLLPRLLRATAEPRYGAEFSRRLLTRVVYLLQLEGCLEGPGKKRRGIDNFQ